MSPDAGRRALTRPRVLLLEDDRAIQRLVEMVAMDCEVDVQAAPSLGAAERALEAGRFDLLLADLMLPDGCAVEWLQRRRLADGAGGPRRVVAFSAGLGETVRRALGMAGVDRFLPKPVSVDEIEACFRVLRADAGESRQGGDGPALAAAAVCACAPGSDPAPSEASQRGATERFFGGDSHLHADFLETWRRGLAPEMARVEQHLSTGDLSAVTRIVHGMKSALHMLGQAQLAHLAAVVEERCAEGDGAPAGLAWGDLRRGLLAWGPASSARQAPTACA